MTFDEAQLILNVKRNDGLEQTLKVSSPLDSVWDLFEACFRITSTCSKPIYPQHWTKRPLAEVHPRQHIPIISNQK